MELTPLDATDELVRTGVCGYGRRTPRRGVFPVTASIVHGPSAGKKASAAALMQVYRLMARTGLGLGFRGARWHQPGGFGSRSGPVGFSPRSGPGE